MNPQNARGGSGSWPALPEIVKAGLVLAVFTLTTRAWTFGNPLINVDEQFYVLTGDRLLHGILPYVDIWDRKPIGLFLLYALICRVFADPIIGYQLLAVLSVTLTGCLVFSIARRHSSFTAALGGAAAYPAWLTVFGGIGGQTPIFYNLPMLGAAGWIISLMAQSDDRRLTRQGCGIMLLVGVALQIKYSVIFEALFFGLSLLWICWARRRSWLRLAIVAPAWIASALAPTLAAWLAYFELGHGLEFVQANFLSIFLDKNDFLPALGRLAGLSLGLVPFLTCAWFAWKHWRGDHGPGKRETVWALAWTTVSIVGFLIFGVWYDLYVLPLLAPLSLVAALSFDHFARQRRVIAMIVGLGLAGGIGRSGVDMWLKGNARDADRLAAMIKPHLGNGCLYVNEDLPILYYLTQSCLPSHYLFPQHLTSPHFENALGVSQMGELQRVLSSRPAAIVIRANPDEDVEPASRAMLKATISRDYVLAGGTLVGVERFDVYVPAHHVP
ncbi:MAG: hypothetical protein ABIM50_01415 [Novosphingobium sp.]